MLIHKVPTFPEVCDDDYILGIGVLTDAMMIKFPAPDAPPIIATTRLGTIAKHRVKKFLIHGFSLKSRNPWTKHI